MAGVVAAMLLLAALPLLVYVPPVQQWLVRQAADIASEETGMQISIDHVSLEFPLDLSLSGVKVVRGRDTVASIGNAVVNVELLPLLKRRAVVKTISIHDATVNTLDLISDTQVKGSMGQLDVDASHANWETGNVMLGKTLLADADVTVILSDTAAVDTTTSEPTLWRIGVEQFALNNVRCKVIFPEDSLSSALPSRDETVSPGGVNVQLSSLVATGGDINLAENQYSIASVSIAGSGLDLWSEGIRQWSVSDLSLNADSLHYDDDGTRLVVRSAALKEQCGLQVTELSGRLSLDSVRVRASDVVLKTPYSYIYAQADVNYAHLSTLSPLNNSDISVDAQLGRQDLISISHSGLFPEQQNGYSPPFQAERLPQWPLTVKGKVSGSLNQPNIESLYVDLPTVVHAECQGASRLSFKAQAYNAAPLLDVFAIDHSSWNIPQGLKVEGDVQIDDRHYAADIVAYDGPSKVKAGGFFDSKSSAYALNAYITDLDISRFLPAVSCSARQSRISIKGSGTDPFDRKSWLEGSVDIGELSYDVWTVDSVMLTASLDDGHALLDINSNDGRAIGVVSIDAQLSKTDISASVSTSMKELNMQSIGAAAHPLYAGFTADFTVATTLGKGQTLQIGDATSALKVSGLMKDIYLRDSVRTFHPDNLGVLLNLRPDTTYARVQNGNFIVKADFSGPLSSLTSRLSSLADTIGHQLSGRIIDQQLIKSMLPKGRLYVTSGRENTVANILKASQDIEFRDLLVDINTSAESGMNGQAHLYGLTIGSTRIDSINLTLKDSSHGLTYQLRAAQKPMHGQAGRENKAPRELLADGHLYEHGARLGVRIFDNDGNMALRLGTQAAMEPGGIRFTLMPLNPTLGYQEFKLNEDNFLFLRRDLKLQAKAELSAADGTMISVYSPEEEATTDSVSSVPSVPTNLQDLTISVHHLDLGRLTSSLPFMPSIAGMMDGDYHLLMDQKKQISVASDMQVNKLAYEGISIGDLSTEFVYLQREDDSHAIDGTLTLDGDMIATLQGSYKNKKVTDGHEYMDGVLTLEHTPLKIVNAFVEDQLIGLEGYAQGALAIKGSFDRPQVNGSVSMESAFLNSQPYGVRLQMDSTAIEIKDSKLTLNEFALTPPAVSTTNAKSHIFPLTSHFSSLTSPSSPLTPLKITGTLDFSNTSNINMDMRIQANNFLLVNAKQTVGSQVYGKAYVNFQAMLRGQLDQLAVRGRLDVLGTTDLTYLLLDSPLSTDNQLDELVKFTDFSDSTQTVVQRPVPSGIDFNLTISIDQGAHLKCGLNADQSNYIDLYGGGNLRLRMTKDEDLGLTGRYTLASGTMKYSMPIIPLKTFYIQEGSYVEFTGDPTNPRLNITATERNKASIGNDDGTSRIVIFDCGVVVTKTLNDMGLQFIISAPEDMTVQSELQSMTVEEQSKLAVTMLTTGMYLGGSNAGSFNMNSALSSFLQSEINTIAGSALNTLDISMGIDNTTDASGTVHTDYSFQFAKRFWNNRLKVQIGGKVSSGQEAQSGQQQSFFDNVTMEYRLSPTSNQYVKLFYKQNVYDWLEGYTGEYGGGFIWRRKLDHWWEAFLLKTKK